MAEWKQKVSVSPEMLTFIGPGQVPHAGWPKEAVLLRFEGLAGGSPRLIFDPNCDVDECGEADLVFVVAAAACQRIFGFLPDAVGQWHLPSDLRSLANAICSCEAPGGVRDTLQLAKSIELLCGIFDHLQRNVFVPADGGGALSEGDARRIVEARRLIDENWHEKLTLDSIAQACGLNRGKLTRGFKAIYNCTVNDALTSRRLAGAMAMLQATDLPVSVIGYRCGYLNNASFTRAFSRHLGVAPTQFRSVGWTA